MPTIQELIKFEICGERCGCRDGEAAADQEWYRRRYDDGICRDRERAAERVVTRLKGPITDLLLASPSIDRACATPDQRAAWGKIVEDRLGSAWGHANRLLNPNDPESRQGWSAFILAMWNYVRKEFTDMVGDDPAKQRIYRVARRLAEAEGHDADMVSMGPPGGHPYHTAKRTVAITAPMQPIWALYWREAEAAIALIDEDNEAHRGFGE
jgi:hypothetical protein